MRKLREVYLQSLTRRLSSGWRLPDAPDLDLQVALESSSGLTLTSYMEEMAKPRTWGGCFEASFLAWKLATPLLGHCELFIWSKRAL